VTYDERLHVPLRWWVQAVMFLASLWLAFVVALPLAVAWAAAGAVAAGTVALLVGYGAARIRLDGDTLWAGRAHIPVSALADPTALDRETSHRLAGRDADHRAYLLLRPYLKRAVRVGVSDPQDPTPYWLLFTRHPERLADAIRAAAAPRFATREPGSVREDPTRETTQQEEPWPRARRAPRSGARTRSSRRSAPGSPPARR
jgi:hypothetical protein